jgi:hypothetical protein
LIKRRETSKLREFSNQAEAKQEALVQEKSELEPQLDVAKTSINGGEENLAATELKISEQIPTKGIQGEA